MNDLTDNNELQTYIHKKLNEQLERNDITREAIDKYVEKYELENLLTEMQKDLEFDINMRTGFLISKLKKYIKKRKKKEEHQKVYIERFDPLFRIQHFILFVSVLALIITGLPIKFHHSGFAKFIFNVFGGIQITSIIHRIGAVGLFLVSILHLYYITLTREGRYNFRKLIPTPKDIKDVIHMLKYFLGLSKTKPEFDRFSYVEKFDYWAVY